MCIMMQNVLKIKCKTAIDLKHIGGDLRVMFTRGSCVAVV